MTLAKTCQEVLERRLVQLHEELTQAEKKLVLEQDACKVYKAAADDYRSQLSELKVPAYYRLWTPLGLNWALY